ncbi:histidine kinase [Micromonospora sp. BRA006-A]|nr:histidine kinase [Micromonospora sp. BRA006-A]
MRCASRSRFLLLLDGGIATVSIAVCLLALLASDAGPDTPSATAVAVGLAVAQASCLLWIRRHPGTPSASPRWQASAWRRSARSSAGSAWSRCRWRTRPGCARPVLARRTRAAAGAHAVETGHRRLAGPAAGGDRAGPELDARRTAAGPGATALRVGTAGAGGRAERISRELHDVVAHHVAVIAVQAAAAGDVFDEHPAQARAARRDRHGGGRR